MLCCVPCRIRATYRVCLVYAVPHCSCCVTVSYSAVLIPCCALCLLCCVGLFPHAGGRWLVMLLPLRFRARSGARYQCLPTRETKPKTMWSCMWNPLPILTKSIDILCPRCETHWCVWSGAGRLTIPYQPTLLAVCHNKTVLPIITGRGVKYTHNDHRNPTVLTHSGGPGLGRIPQGRHPSLEVIP